MQRDSKIAPTFLHCFLAILEVNAISYIFQMPLNSTHSGITDKNNP